MSLKITCYSIVLLLLIYVQSISATTTTITLNPTMDNFLHGVGHNDENEGSKTYLRIQNYDRYSHILVQFDQAALQTAAAGQYLLSASLELYIETNFNNWQSGGIVAAHKLLNEWTELGSTWNCPTDTNLNNTSPDCATQWNGGIYEVFPSSTVFHQNGDIGWKSFNVTQDVAGILLGVDNFGWLIRKLDPASNGSVDYTSAQGNSTRRPPIILQIVLSVIWMSILIPQIRQRPQVNLPEV